MKKIIVHENTIDIDQIDGVFYLNGHKQAADISKQEDGSLKLTLDNQTYTVDIVEIDKKDKIIKLLIDGKSLELQYKDKLNLALEKIGFSGSHQSQANEVKAPMPGTILDIMVSVGDQVEIGQPLMILEAMKMENIIKSTVSGEIRSLCVQKGDSVEKGKILLIF